MKKLIKKIDPETEIYFDTGKLITGAYTSKTPPESKHL